MIFDEFVYAYNTSDSVIDNQVNTIIQKLYDGKIHVDKLLKQQNIDGLSPLKSDSQFNRIYNIRYYPVDYALSSLSVYLVSKDVKYLKIAEKQLSWSIDLIEEGVFTVPYKNHGRVITRDSLVRFISSFYMAYKITNDKKYLEIAENQLRILTSLKRSYGLYKWRVHKLFNYVYDSKTYKAIEGGEINPNQDAETAFAIACLVSEPRSKYFKDKKLLEIINEELNATRALSDETGTLFCAQSEFTYDIGYASYAMRSYMMTMLLLGKTFEHADKITDDASWHEKVLKKFKTIEKLPQSNSGAALDRFLAYLCSEKPHDNNFDELQLIINNNSEYHKIIFLRYIILLHFIRDKQNWRS